MKVNIYYFLFVLVIYTIRLSGQCAANAGTDQQTTSGGTVTLSGSASGGTAPYTYSWTPSTFLSATNASVVVANSVTATTVYTLTITDNAACTATSQVWVYIPNQTFMALSKSLDGGYQKIASNNHLYFTYNGEYNTGTLKYNIYNDSRTAISTTSVSLNRSVGDNRFDVNLGTLGITSSGYYILEVINEKKEKYYLKFKK